MTPFPSATELRAPLLAWLQGAVGPCRYAEPPTPMTPGNDTQVHALALDAVEGPLVLRVFRRDTDPRRPAFESAIQNGLAGQGLPVPRALASCADPEVIGAPFFLMQRLPGTPLHGDAIRTDADGIPQADWRRTVRKGERC